jgi:hypothetical protein
MSAAYAGHNRVVRAWLAMILAVLAALLGACQRNDDPVAAPPEPFCEAAVDLEEGLVEGVGLEKQIELVRRLVATAPAEIEADAQTFLDALEAVRADPDNPELRDDPDVREAVDRVNRYATQGCELFEQGGGGSPF